MGLTTRRLRSTALVHVHKSICTDGSDSSIDQPVRFHKSVRVCGTIAATEQDQSVCLSHFCILFLVGATKSLTEKQKTYKEHF